MQAYNGYTEWKFPESILSNILSIFDSGRPIHMAYYHHLVIGDCCGNAFNRARIFGTIKVYGTTE